eukprot:scaffold14124_cov234-Alexandrium_tamarense.AAC.1
MHQCHPDSALRLSHKVLQRRSEPDADGHEKCPHRRRSWNSTGIWNAMLLLRSLNSSLRAGALSNE